MPRHVTPDRDGTPAAAVAAAAGMKNGSLYRMKRKLSIGIETRTLSAFDVAPG